MGPYCKFCNQRCFVPIPKGTPERILVAYGTANLMATCTQGKAAERAQRGYCYDDTRQPENLGEEVDTAIEGLIAKGLIEISAG